MAWIGKCEYKRAEAVEIIKDADKVYIKKGLWNKYELVDVKEAESRIMNSEIGAHVFYDDVKGMYYVSCPYASDEW